MPTHFFAAPEFLGLLRYWDQARGPDPVPVWHDDLAALPEALREHLIISEGQPDQIYRYIGAECQRRWHGNPTGQAIAPTLGGEHARYIIALCDDTLARRAPIFSAAVYQTDDTNMMMTGRLFVPLTLPQAPGPTVVMAVQLFRGPDLLPAIGTVGFVHEIRRDMIAVVPALCARLEEASRYFRISRGIHHRDIARDMDTVAQEMSGSALIPLACLPEPHAE
jgi:hypothetical protein